MTDTHAADSITYHPFLTTAHSTTRRARYIVLRRLRQDAQLLHGLLCQHGYKDTIKMFQKSGHLYCFNFFWILNVVIPILSILSNGLFLAVLLTFSFVLAVLAIGLTTGSLTLRTILAVCATATLLIFLVAA